MKFFIPLIFLLLPALACNTRKSEMYAKKGVLTVDSQKLNSNKNIALKGEWEFYPEKLLSPDSFKTKKIDVQYINLPSTGKLSKLKNINYATFRLKLIIKNYNSDIALSNKRIFSAYKIWTNNKLVSTAGKINTDPQKYVPELKISFIKISPETFYNDTLEIIVQTANFDDPLTGIITPFYISEYQSSFRQKTLETSILFGVISIVFIIGFFSLTMFFIRRKDFSSLYLTGLSVVFIVFGISTNDTFIKNLFLSDFTVITRLTHISVSMYPAFIMLFFQFIYPKEISKTILYFALITSLLLLTFSIFADISTIRSLAVLKGSFILLIFAYLLFYSLPLAIIRKRKGSFPAYLGMIFLSATSINDTLFSMNIINTGYISIYGFLLYFIFQSVNLALNFAQSLSKNEQLLSTLDFQNKNLEKIVVERTIQIQEKQTEIIARNKQLVMQNEEIKAQKEDIFNKNEKIKHQNAQTLSSIKYAGTIQKAVLPVQNEIEKSLNIFILNLPKEKVSGDFYWFASKKNEKKQSEKIFLAVVDCTGHGVPGAFMSILGNMILNNIILNQNIHKPSEILSEMDKEIIKTLKQQSNNNTDGMDICLCRIDKKNEKYTKVTFSGAKSPLYFVNNKGKVTRFKGSPKPLGGIISDYFDFFYTDTVITPQKGDSFYLTTDGFVDQNNPERQRFGTVKLMKLLRIISKRPVSQQKAVLQRELIDFSEGEEQRDDITVLGFNI